MTLVERHLNNTWWLVGFLEDESHWDLVKSNNPWTGLFLFVIAVHRIKLFNPSLVGFVLRKPMGYKVNLSMMC